MKRVFIDMDNVLVDFQSGLDLVSEEVKAEYDGRLDEIPGLFAKMKPMEGAIEAVHELEKHYDLFILSTAPWKNPSAWSDKVEWVTKYLDDVFHKRLIISHRKDLCQGDYLIDEGYWAEQFKDIDKDKWPIYEGSLGNLLLLSQNINAELQNDDFKTKKEGRESADESKKRTGYSKGSAAELEVNNEKDWTPETIEKTGMTMLKFMEDDQWGWGIKFKSEEEKKNLLLPGIY